MAAPSSKHIKDPKAKIEMRSRLKYNLENIMSIEQIGKGFKENTFNKEYNASGPQNCRNFEFFIN